MASPTEILLSSALVIALAVKAGLPICRSIEKKQAEESRAAVEAVSHLKKSLKPGTYTFRWQNERLQEPTSVPPQSLHEATKVVVKFINGDRSFESVERMPRACQRQLLEIIRNGLDIES